MQLKAFFGNSKISEKVRSTITVIEKLSTLGGWLGALCLVSLTLLILMETFLRALSNVFPFIPGAMPNAWEYSTYLMACGFSLAAAEALRQGVHIRVISVLQIIDGRQKPLELISLLIGLITSSWLAYAMYLFLVNSIERQQVSLASLTPLWPVRGGIFLGVTLLALQFLACVLRRFLGLSPFESLQGEG